MPTKFESMCDALAAWEETIIQSVPPVLGLWQEFTVQVAGDVYDAWEAHQREHTSDNPWQHNGQPDDRYRHSTREVQQWPRYYKLMVVRSGSFASDYETIA